MTVRAQVFLEEDARIAPLKAFEVIDFDVENIDALATLLEETNVIKGTVIMSDRGEGRDRVVTGRYPVLLSTAKVTRVSPAGWTYVEQD